MVDDSTPIALLPARAGFAPRVSELALLVFLLLIFIGLAPFAIRDPAALSAGVDTSGATGDLARQLCYACIFALIVFVALYEQGLRAFTAVPPLLALLLVWCLASAAWSPEPDVTFRRAGLATVVVLSATLSVSMVGVARSFQLLRWVLAFVLVVNWLSIPLIHQAVHLPGEIDPKLVGNWRGLYFHKNIAGSVTAISAIVFLFSAWETRRPLDMLLFFAAVIFTVMTRSKASLLLLPVALAAGAVYRLAWRNALDRLIVTVFLGLVLLLAAAIVTLNQSAITRLLEDPTEFTGRAEIWQAEFAFIRDHPYRGAGFGSFADTGALSPLHDYVSNGWVDTVAHGHNAYLQLFVTIGGVGFALTVLSLVVAPLVAFWRGGGSDAARKSMLFAIFVFMVLHNFLESDFLEGDGAAWVAFLMVLAALQVSRRERSVSDDDPSMAPQ
jgi:exopolysaccharide production protein ExoQ